MPEMQALEWLQLLVLWSFKKFWDQDRNILVNRPTNISLKDSKGVQLQKGARAWPGHHTSAGPVGFNILM